MCSVTECVAEFTPSPEDWAEFTAWSAAPPDPEPTPEDVAWDDGYQAGRAGEHDGPVGRDGPVRAAWWAGFTAGFAAASTARADAYRATGFLHPDVADWLAATPDVTGWPD